MELKYYQNKKYNFFLGVLSMTGISSHITYYTYEGINSTVLHITDTEALYVALLGY